MILQNFMFMGGVGVAGLLGLLVGVGTVEVVTGSPMTEVRRISLEPRDGYFEQHMVLRCYPDGDARSFRCGVTVSDTSTTVVE